ncbi:MAG: TetR/AcrR family transcriptional regulator [Alphaproteobacteria bacterium]|nr:TetR/AcrR family transcriptional regulator [Alphaproteobacteria bacterium]
MMQLHDWEAVSVQNICDAADIARSTFYLHFSGKAELLDYAFRYLGEEMRGETKTRNLDADCKFSVMPALVEKMTSPYHAFLFNREVGSQTIYLVRDRLLQVVEKILAEEIQASKNHCDTPASVLAFISAGVLATIGTIHTAKSLKQPTDILNDIDTMISNLLIQHAGKDAFGAQENCVHKKL